MPGYPQVEPVMKGNLRGIQQWTVEAEHPESELKPPESGGLRGHGPVTRHHEPGWPERAAPKKKTPTVNREAQGRWN
jgi:hypothetical protein